MILLINQKKISHQELQALCQAHFDTMVKFVADVQRECLAVGGELHADGEAMLPTQASRQSDLWGGNFYPWNIPEQRQFE